MKLFCISLLIFVASFFVWLFVVVCKALLLGCSSLHHWAALIKGLGGNSALVLHLWKRLVQIIRVDGVFTYLGCQVC